MRLSFRWNHNLMHLPSGNRSWTYPLITSDGQADLRPYPGSGWKTAALFRVNDLGEEKWLN